MRGSAQSQFLLVCRWVLMIAAIPIAGCDGQREDPSEPKPSESQTAQGPQPLKLVFTYGSEKEKWVSEVTERFNREVHELPGGRRIAVEAVPMGSGECIDELLSETRKAHLTSPASGAFVELGNAKSRAKTGQDLLGPSENLLLSPVVIAMWAPMAEALGYGTKPIGWADILALARDPRGWAAHEQPQWGAFKLGHTHPEFSNSGLISVLAEVYAAAGKTAGLTLADLDAPATAEFVRDIERSVVHYGSSTGFFGRKMFANGPRYLSAAILYENMVIESYEAKGDVPIPVVAVYPKEGTFWSDHPVAIVQRPWVTAEHRDAARLYIEFLMARAQQERALAYGFRPGDPSVPLAAPIDAAHGVNPAEPKTTLQVPTADVMDGVLALWHKNKKPSNVVLILDTSGSMNKEQRMPNAIAGAQRLVAMLGEQDRLSLLPFSSQPTWAGRDMELGPERKAIQNKIGSLFPEGGTALYDAIEVGHRYLLERSRPGAISAVIVLTDGEDTDSKTSLTQLLEAIRFDPEKRPVRVFPIGYGSGANKAILQSIADATEARFYEGTPQNIREVFRDLSTFF